ADGERQLPLAPTQLQSQVQTRCGFGSLNVGGRCQDALLVEEKIETSLWSLSDSDPPFIVSDRGRHTGFARHEACCRRPRQVSLTFGAPPLFGSRAGSHGGPQCETTLAATTRTGVVAREAARSDPRDQGRRARGIACPWTRSAGVGHRSRPSLLGSGP